MDQRSESLLKFENHYIAPAMAIAHRVIKSMEVAFLGANRPKLANSDVSQKASRAMNAFGVPWPTCWDISQRASPIFPASFL